jgi:predicted RND superfamily exporter protein
MLQSLFGSQIKSFGIILLSIFVMFIILFQSLKISLLGMIPNIVASTFILGLIGLLRIPLDIMTITIAAVTIGIAVDNTIHYLYKIKVNNKENIDLNKSIENTHETVGYAVMTTSLTIAFGFSVLGLSNFIPTILFGLFTALAMIIAMFGVLITLPASLIRFKL